MISTFFIITMIVLLGLIVVPFTGLFLVYRKYGAVLPRNVAIVVWLVILSYLALFCFYAGDLVPERYKLESTQVYQCEWKTVYVEKSK